MSDQVTASVEYLNRGSISSSIASTLLNNDMDMNALRPYRGHDGRTYIDRYVGNSKYEPKLVANADAALPFEAWREIDRAVVDAAKPELRIMGDLAAAGLVRTVDAMSLTMVSYQTRTGDAEARIVMRPTTRSRRDRPSYGIRNTPLPFIISDWSFDIRDINIARKGGQPLDLTQIREGTRAVMETAEDALLGVSTAFEYDGASMPGMLNFSDALTKVLTAPTAGGWTPETLYNEINSMRQLSIDNYFAGPWMLYFSAPWDIYLNKKYSAAYQSGTLRSEILGLDGISGVRMLRRLSGYKIIMIQMTDNVFQMINGLPIRAYQWEGPGGWEIHGRVMTCVVPQPRSDSAGQTGIVIGST